MNIINRSELTGRERLKRIFAGQTTDRPAIKIWGLEPNQSLKHPDYEKVYKLGLQYTDLTPTAYSPVNILFGSLWDEISSAATVKTDSEEWVDTITTVKLPRGRTLRSVYRKSTMGKPGRIMEYYIKEKQDLIDILELPYKPYPFQAEPFFEMERLVGDRGITTFILPEPIYHLQRHMGSETLAYFSVDNRELLLESLKIFSGRTLEFAREAFDAGVEGIMGWTGPEVCIPPLMSYDDFEEYVFKIDKPIIDLVHEKGARFWVHCHGKMKRVIERFAEMGADMLNPIEPPPMGDITLDEAFSLVGNRMGLEGNLEVDEMMLSSEERIRFLVREALDIGSRYGRFILCPSSGYMEQADPSEQYIRNFCAYIREAVAYVTEK